MIPQNQKHTEDKRDKLHKTIFLDIFIYRNFMLISKVITWVQGQGGTQHDRFDHSAVLTLRK
jgi:hypothetical protein